MLSLGSWAEIIIIVIAALILVGPAELPQVLKTCGRFVFKLKRFSNQIQDGLNDLINEGQIEEYEQAAREKAGINTDITTPDPHIIPAIPVPVPDKNDHT